MVGSSMRVIDGDEARNSALSIEVISIVLGGELVREFEGEREVMNDVFPFADEGGGGGYSRIAGGGEEGNADRGDVEKMLFGACFPWMCLH